MRRQVLPALRAFLVFSVVCGLLYPLLMTVAAQALFKSDANGSLVRNANGRVVGSSLLGQQFTKPAYFHPRPSAAGDGYDTNETAASNLGPTNPELVKLVKERAAAYRAENALAADAKVPVDAVTASASGLDPHISMANALLQVPRVAAARGMSEAAVRSAVRSAVDDRPFGLFGEPGVNVLMLNLALGRLAA
jgi:K+-transporting ATPase ATPase C chain